MRTIHDHAAVIHSLDHFNTQIGQRDIGIMTAARDGVVAVIGKVDLLDAKLGKDRHHFGHVLQHDRTFKVKPDTQQTLGFGKGQIIKIFDLHVFVRVGGNFGPEGRNHTQDMGNRAHIHADIDTDIIDMARDIGIKQLDGCLFIERQAGMCIPGK